MCWLFDLIRNFFVRITTKPKFSKIEQEIDLRDNHDFSMPKWSIERVLNEEMLSDNEIYESLLILQQEFKHLKGFRDPQSFNARFVKNPSKIIQKSSDKFVQILHDGNAHWITITNIGTNQNNHIRIFDSLYDERTYYNNQMIINFLKRFLFLFFYKRCLIRSKNNISITLIEWKHHGMFNVSPIPEDFKILFRYILKSQFNILE